MSDLEAMFIPAQTRFSSGDVVFWSDRDRRSLDDAIAEADLLVTGPHATGAIPAELKRYCAPALTQRLAFDFSDLTTDPIARRWVELDPRVIYIRNPHPRVVRDANRPRPDDIAATLRRSFEAVENVGPGHRVDLAGIDAIRPVTFGFWPVLVAPPDDDALARMVADFTEIGARGVDVYERERDKVFERLVEARARAARDSGTSQSLTTLSFHDTMNHTARADGAVCVERAEQDRLPAVVALSNRGDVDGARLRLLADAHRTAFAVRGDAVELNRPYLGGHETTTAGRRIAELNASVERVQGVALGAVQAEFCREFLLGPAAAAELMSPGTGWPDTDDAVVEAHAVALAKAFESFRRAES